MEKTYMNDIEITAEEEKKVRENCKALGFEPSRAEIELFALLGRMPKEKLRAFADKVRA